MPKHIKLFEKLCIASLILGIINIFFGQSIESLSTSEEAPSTFGTLIGFGLMIGLVLLTSRRRSKIAKWILVIAVVVGMIPYVSMLPQLFESFFVGTLSLVITVMQLLAVYFLFTPDSRAWLSKSNPPSEG